MKKDFNKLYQTTLGRIDHNQVDPMKGMKTSPGFIDKLNQSYDDTFDESNIDINNTTMLSAHLLYSSAPECLEDIFITGFLIGQRSNTNQVNTIQDAMDTMIAKHMSTIDNMELKDSQLAMLAFNAFKLSAKLWIEHRNACETQEDVFQQDCEFARFIEDSVL